MAEIMPSKNDNVTPHEALKYLGNFLKFSQTPNGCVWIQSLVLVPICPECFMHSSKHNQIYKLCQLLGGSKVQVYISNVYFDPRGWFSAVFRNFDKICNILIWASRYIDVHTQKSLFSCEYQGRIGKMSCARQACKFC